MNNKEKGQSLVEFALIAPALIIMFIGVLEVGWILRGHLALSNAVREATRMAVRPGYLTFETEGYDRIVGHTFTAIADQLEFEKHGTEIISVVEIDTQLVYDLSRRDEPNYSCEVAASDPVSQTLVITPLTVQTYTYKYPLTSTKQTRIDFVAFINKVVPQERLINCEIQMQNGIYQINRIVIVELFYDQPQLFGFPLVSNPYTDPVPHYAWLAMRSQVVREIKKGS